MYPGYTLEYTFRVYTIVCMQVYINDVGVSRYSLVCVQVYINNIGVSRYTLVCVQVYTSMYPGIH